jgi:hypothetical protein
MLSIIENFEKSFFRGTGEGTKVREKFGSRRKSNLNITATPEQQLRLEKLSRISKKGVKK